MVSSNLQATRNSEVVLKLVGTVIEKSNVSKLKSQRETQEYRDVCLCGSVLMTDDTWTFLDNPDIGMSDGDDIREENTAQNWDTSPHQSLSVHERKSPWVCQLYY